MIEECGLKGHQLGGALISPRHANFIENAGGATSADCIALMAEARRRVQERFGVELQHEVQFLGPLRAAGVGNTRGAAKWARGRPPQDVRSDRGTSRAPQRARARAVRAVGALDHRRGCAARDRDRRVSRRAKHVAVRGPDDSRSAAAHRSCGERCGSRFAPRWGRACCASTRARSTSSSQRSAACERSRTTVRSRTRSGSSSAVNAR